jgi:hypothetical protein
MSRQPLWSSGQSSWLQIQRSEFDSRRYQFFWGVVGLERGSLSLVSTIEELLGRKSSCSDLEIREYGRRDPSCWPHGTLYPQKLALSSPTSCGRSVGIVRLRTQAKEFSFFYSFRDYMCTEVSSNQKFQHVMMAIKDAVSYIQLYLTSAFSIFGWDRHFGSTTASEKLTANIAFSIKHKSDILFQCCHLT